MDTDRTDDRRTIFTYLPIHSFIPSFLYSTKTFETIFKAIGVCVFILASNYLKSALEDFSSWGILIHCTVFGNETLQLFVNYVMCHFEHNSY